MDALRVHAEPPEPPLSQGTDVARLPGFHDIVQRFERLLDRCRVVPAMNDIEIDVVLAVFA